MAEWIVELGDGNIHIKKMSPIVRCKDCKHRPVPNGNNHPLTPKPSEFEWDETCPYVCADEWHNEMPDDNDYCSKGERKDVEE